MQEKVCMANKTDDIKRLVSERGGVTISGEEWDLLRETFPRVVESRLRKTLLELGLQIEQPWRGVDTHSLCGLEETLHGLADFYTREPALARKLVIAAKDKTRFAARNPKVAAEKRALKLEMVDWMLVWLGDPAMFSAWVRLRKNQLNPPA
jgi:hypothetical protein